MNYNFQSFEGGISKRNIPKNFSKKDMELFEHEFTKGFPKTHVEIIHNAKINYWGYIFKNFKVNPLSFRGKKTPGNFKLINQIIFFLKNNRIYKKRRMYEEAIWFTDPWSAGYFHWFTDALPRLFLVLKQVNTQTKLLMSSRFLECTYVAESLDLLGVDKDCIEAIELGEIASIKHLILPYETSTSTGNYHDILFNNLRQKIKTHINGLKDITQGLGHRVYITRMNSARRKVINELEVIELIRNYDFQIYDFDKLPWLKQVNICYNSKTLMSLHGAAITNMIFMKEGGSIIEFRRQGDGLNNCYFSLASTCNLDYFYLKCEKRNVVKKKIGDGMVEDSDVVVSISDLEKLLDNYFAI